MRSCDETAALERFAELLESPEETEEASRVADEDLRRYLGRTRRDRSSG